MPTPRVSDLEDFNLVLCHHGRAIDEFEVVESPSRIEPLGATFGPVVSQIRVRCRANSVERAYKTGGIEVSHNPLTKWVQEFSHDLASGVFS